MHRYNIPYKQNDTGAIKKKTTHAKDKHKLPNQ